MSDGKIIIPPGFGDGVRVNKPVDGGERARPSLLRRRLLQDGERTYTAYSAHELLEIEAEANGARPGFNY